MGNLESRVQQVAHRSQKSPVRLEQVVESVSEGRLLPSESMRQNRKDIESTRDRNSGIVENARCQAPVGAASHPKQATAMNGRESGQKMGSQAVGGHHNLYRPEKTPGLSKPPGPLQNFLDQSSLGSQGSPAHQCRAARGRDHCRPLVTHAVGPTGARAANAATRGRRDAQAQRRRTDLGMWR